MTEPAKPWDGALVRKWLDRRVVAEGVETEAVAQRLAAMGCDEGQGYAFARPLELAAFNDWLQPQVGS